MGTVVYEAEIIQDTEEDANVDQRHLGYFPTLGRAAQAVNAAKDPANGWHTGAVYKGRLIPPVFGVRPERFEMDEETASWFVGIDGKPTL